MKNIFLSLSLLVTLSSVAQSTLPAIEKYKLSNGLEVIFADYGSLPAVSISFYVNTGKKNEIPGQQSLSELTANALQFGCEKYSRIAEGDLVTELGGSFSVGSNDNYSKISLDFPTSETDRGMGLAAAIFLKPTFPVDEIKQYVSQQLNYNNPMRMDIGALAEMYGDLLVYGSAHPLGRHFYAAQLNKITAAQVKEFYQFNYTPKNTKLVVTGKPDKEKMKKLIEQYFGSWTAEYGEVNGASYDILPINKQEVAFVNKPRATQAALIWYKKAPLSGSKDVTAFKIANRVFSNVLFDQIRGKEGKTYGISSKYSEAESNGIFTVSTQVRSQVMFATTQSFDNVLKAFFEKGITQEQLDQAKISFRNSVLSMQQPSEMADFINPWVYKDYNKRKEYLTEIDKLDLESVNKIIKKYYTPDSYKLIIAGNESKLEEQLQQLKGLARIPLKSIEVDN